MIKSTRVLQGLQDFCVTVLLTVVILRRLGKIRSEISTRSSENENTFKISRTVQFFKRSLTLVGSSLSALGTAIWYVLPVLLLLACSLFLGYRSLYVDEGGPAVLPAIALVTWPQAADLSYRPQTSVTVTADPSYFGCGWVHVTARFQPNYGFFEADPAWAAYRKGGAPPITHFAIGFADVLPPRNIKVRLDYTEASYTFTRSGKPLLKPYGIARAKAAISVGTLQASYGSLNTFALPGTISDWPVHQLPIVVSFDADWTSYQAVGSCYIQLPSLVAEDAPDAAAWAADVIEIGANIRSVDSHEPTSNGQVTIAVQNGTSTVDSRSVTPANPSGYSWSCSPTFQENGPDCNGLVVASRQDADNIRSFVTFISAALFSLALQVIYEKTRRRKKTHRKAELNTRNIFCGES
jgi:hypothetical protein